MEESLKNIIFDKPHPNEWKEFMRIRLESLQHDPQAFGKSFEEESQLSDEEWQKKFSRNFGDTVSEFLSVAKDVGRYIGIIAAWKKDSHTAVLKAVYVCPKYRGLGISEKMLQQTIENIKTDGEITKIELTVNTKQDAAIALYRKFNFVLVETRTNQKLGDGKFYDEYVMQLKIN